MAKGHKSATSSASSATRKKHAARKAGGTEQQLPLPKEKKKDKGKGRTAEPRVKLFIPPSKPVAVRPDPLDSLGIAKQLPPELHIVLRRLAKKDSVTKRKALEVLQTAWVAPALKGGSDTPAIEPTLATSLPVWLHHVPSLLLHSSRRIRLLAAAIHTALIRIPALCAQLVSFLRDAGDATQVAAVLGSWCMAAEDVDRQVATHARRAWDLVFRSSPASGSALHLDDNSRDLLLAFVQRALFDPAGVYADLNPVQPAFVPSLPAHALPHGKGGARHVPAPPPPAAKPVQEEDGVGRRPEDEEESESDRNGRLRVGALGVLKWTLEQQDTSISESLSELLTSPLLWTSLYHGPSPPFCDVDSSSGFIGDSQPIVRKVSWAVLLSLLKRHKAAAKNTYLEILSHAVLRSAWVEPDAGVRAVMWEPLLVFLTQFPNAWELDLAATVLASKSEEHNATEEGDGEADNASDASGARDDEAPAAQAGTQSEAYREFLQFLQLGCHGSPIQGYPTVVVVLSTIPRSILDAAARADFLASFWAALDGRAFSSLERATSSAAFLSALLECLVLLSKRARASTKGLDGTEAPETTAVVGEQVARVWEELALGRLRVESKAAGSILARTLASLEGVDEALFSAAWAPIASTVLAACDAAGNSTGLAFLHQLALLDALSGSIHLGTALSHALTTLVLTSAGDLAEQCMADLGKKSEVPDSDSAPAFRAPERLTGVLQTFGTIVFGNAVLAARIDALAHEHLHALLSSTPALLLAYLAQRGDVVTCSRVWGAMLRAVASDPSLQVLALSALLGGAEAGVLPPYLRPAADEMDGLAKLLVEDVLADSSVPDEARLKTVRRLLETPDPFISRRAASGLLHSIIFTFSEKSRALMRSISSSEPESVLPLRVPLELISATICVRTDTALSVDVRAFLPDIFVFGYLFPYCEPPDDGADELCTKAKQIWQVTLSAEAGLEEQNQLFASARAALRELVSGVDSRPSPEAILQVVSEGHLGSSSDVLRDFFPSAEELDDILEALPSNPLDPILAVVDPLVPPPSLWKDSESSAELQPYDRAGMSAYARIVHALLSVAADDRRLARTNTWLLRHFLTLAQAATERLMLPAADSVYFARGVAEEALQDIVARVQTLTSFLLADVGDDGWHNAITQAFLKGTGQSQLPGVSGFIATLLSVAMRTDTVRESKVLYTVMQHILNGATPADAEQWVALARRLEKQSPNTALAIVLAIAESALEPPGLARYRNEAAAGVLGVPAAKANSDGLRLLRRLACATPDPDSDVEFLPPTRAVNFMRACQAWVASDEDVDEDVESEMTLLFRYLAPILQNVPGAHWELVFDVIENNLENGSFADETTLPALARTMKLVVVVQELTSTNKSLRTDWREHELPILTLIRNLVQKASAVQSSASVPRSICWETAFSIMQELPPSLVDHESLPNMAHLLLDPSPEIAKMAYALLHAAAKKRTEYLVVEAGVDTSTETAKYELPAELLQVVQTALILQGDQAEPNILGYLLGWMVIFDLFNDASLRVKMGYASQLRDLDLISSSFLPNILDLVEVYGGRIKRLELWSVEEYFVQLYDSESSFSPKLLAAHLFYRALLNVPSLISTWWGNCKDRQLSTAVESLTMKHYSPVLIAAELSHVKDPAGVEELAGENWSIKIAARTGEVSASYTVDDQEMEITVRLPPDYPLRGIEVRGVRKLGVEEKWWRGWLLAVQQIVTSQNGRIVDGLSMFKKNVTHHFENQTECAICYSIISVVELSLPKKSCRTCKNRFHAECLYKWFNTSHTSSCPLCRSDFI